MNSLVYKQKVKPLVFSHSSIHKKGEYTLVFKDLPQEEKPRERLLSSGVSSLKLSELLALIFNTGTKKEDVLAMSSRLIKEYGEKSLLNTVDPKKLSLELSIPLVKAMQVVSCIEIGKRLFDKKTGIGKTLRKAKDVFDYTHDMRELPKEHLRGIYLNTHYKVIHEEVLSIGTIDSNLVHAREVFRPAIEHSAAAVILVHNHPSGNPVPSLADREITEQIKEAGDIIGISLLDHVIVAKSGYRSILEK